MIFSFFYSCILPSQTHSCHCTELKASDNTHTGYLFIYLFKRDTLMMRCNGSKNTKGYRLRGKNKRGRVEVRIVEQRWDSVFHSWQYECTHAQASLPRQDHNASLNCRPRLCQLDSLQNPHWHDSHQHWSSTNPFPSQCDDSNLKPAGIE